jgi:hypothetical protein
MNNVPADVRNAWNRENVLDDTREAGYSQVRLRIAEAAPDQRSTAT